MVLLLGNEISSLDELRGWMAKVTSLSTLILDTQTTLDDLSVKRHFAVVENNTKSTLKLDGEIRRNSHKLDMYLVALREWTNCVSLDELHELITDVKVRTSNAYELYEGWRKYVSYMELAHAVGRFPEDMTLESCQQTSTALQLEFEIQMALVRKTIGNRKVLT